MGAAASVGSTPEERAVNNEQLLKELASEYEALRSAGTSDADIATKLEATIKQKAPLLWTPTTITVPSPLKTRVIVDYDLHTGHKVVTQLDEVVPSPHPPSASGDAQKPAPQPAAGAEVVELKKVIEGTAKTVEALRNSHNNRFMVAIDGSDTSHQAYLTALRLRKGTDPLDLVHFFDPQAESKLAASLRPAAIKERYEVDLVSRLPSERYHLHWLEKGDLTTRALVVGYVNEQASSHAGKSPVSFLCLGYTGRRGPGEDPQLMGSVADLTLRAAHVPTILVKTAVPEADKARVFVVAVDEAERSFNAYLTTLLLARPKDKLIVFHIYDDSGAMKDGVDELLSSPQQRVDTLHKRYETDMKDRGLVSPEFVAVAHQVGTSSVHDTILNFSLEREADIVVVAPRPQEKMSSVAEHVIRRGKANVMVVKSS